MIWMKLISDPQEMTQTVLADKRARKTVGCVPTMGALHDGHLSLIRAARRDCDLVVVTIFVNPTQFGPAEDLDDYPRSIEEDLAACEREGTDYVFAPSDDAMYPKGAATWVTVEGVTEGLCGASRPGHFRGVTTVVAKLFNIVQPDKAYFGEKDYQQLTAIRNMAVDLNFPVEIVPMPIVREPDGLAISSRNKYLSAEERRDALALQRSLELARTRLADGERSAHVVVAKMRALIDEASSARIDYVAVVDAETLEPVERIEGTVLVAVAVYIGSTRLIDNTVVTV